jgi:hypothetical protein
LLDAERAQWETEYRQNVQIEPTRTHRSILLPPGKEARFDEAGWDLWPYDPELDEVLYGLATVPPATASTAAASPG